MTALSEKQKALLKGLNFGVVSTVDGAGRPQTSVVWVDTDGEHVVFNTTNARAKGRNLRENPELSISVWDNDDPYNYFEVEGTAELDLTVRTSTSTSCRSGTRARHFHTPVDRVIVRIKARAVLDYGIG